VADDEYRQYAGLRWGVRAVLTLGVAASVAANILHARSNPISQTIAAWPPIALLLAVELVSRVPVRRRWLTIARVGATVVIASIAAYVSYWHMAGVAARYGEESISAHLLPLSVDGLIVIGSICLVELGAHRRPLATTAGPVTAGPATERRHPRLTEFAPGIPASTGPDRPATEEPAAVGGYEPSGEEDALMYAAWQAGLASGREPSGADLARAAGRANDASGIGRRAVRRYRETNPANTRFNGHKPTTRGEVP
jgi:hypothetical protein